MKIILPVHHFPPHHSAGAELYTLRLARALIERGHAAEVVTVESIDKGPVGELRVSHDAYQGVPVWRLAFNLMEAPERRRWDFDNPLLGGWFAEHLGRARPDLVHFQAGYLIGAAPLRAAAQAGVPVALTLHDYWFLCPRITLLRGDGSLCTSIPESPAGCAWCRCTEQRRYQAADELSRGLAGKLARRVVLGRQADLLGERRERLAEALRLPDVLIAPSSFLARQFEPYAEPGKLRVLGYGVDVARFRAVPAGGGGEALRIGYTGQIAPHKGLHLLIEAFRALRTGARPAELHLYGGLDPRPDYVRRLRDLAGDDARVHFHGRFEHERLPAILGGLDVMVTPSTWYENSPLAIMEAQAAGKPVVTSKLGGMAELVCDGVDGLHFAPDDAADLARKLQRLLDEPRLLGELRAGVRPPASVDDEMAQLLEIYRGLGAGA